MVAITELEKGKTGVGGRVLDDPAHAGWVAKVNLPALSTALEKKGGGRSATFAASTVVSKNSGTLWNCVC